MPVVRSVAQLLVEGKNDRHVVWALCQKYNVPEVFSVETPGDAGGVDALLDSLPVRLKTSGLRALGLMLDADLDINARWDRVRNRLTQAGYDSIPQLPVNTGTIIRTEGKPIVGVWIMPNNNLPGMLEDFVAHLIPEDDLLVNNARFVLDNMESEGLNRYALVHRPKAFIHTWLAWQETPGQPMGQAITANVLNHRIDLANLFVTWLNNLFDSAAA